MKLKIALNNRGRQKREKDKNIDDKRLSTMKDGIIYKTWYYI